LNGIVSTYFSPCRHRMSLLYATNWSPDKVWLAEILAGFLLTKC